MKTLRFFELAEYDRRNDSPAAVWILHPGGKVYCVSRSGTVIESAFTEEKILVDESLREVPIHWIGEE